MKSGFYLLILLLAGCHPKVINYLNPKVNFSSYHSYFITNVKVKNAEISPEGESIINNIESAAKAEMEKRAYQPSNVGADLVLRYEIISNRVTNVSSGSSYGMYSPFAYPYNRITVSTFLESAILFELRDLKTDKAIWNASVDLNQYKKGNKTDQIIQTAVQNIFDTYPYKAGSNTPDESLISK